MSDNYGLFISIICIAFFSWTGFLYGKESAYEEICNQKQGIFVKVSGQYVCLKVDKL